MTLVISLPGASGFKAQMVAPHVAVGAMVPLTLLVTLCSWRSLSAPGVFSAPGCSLSQACSGLGSWLSPVSVDVPVLDLLLQRSQNWEWSYKSLWL